MDLALNFKHYIKLGQCFSAYTPKPGSHDDGPSCGPFYGGIGAPAFSRSFTGSFNRWHLQPGYHGCRDISSALLLVWWKLKGHRPKCRVLSLQDPEVEGVKAMKESQLQVGILFPFTIEHYSAADMPMDLYLRFFSPLVPEDLVPEDPEAAALPVMYIDVELHNRTDSEVKTGVALFWPNQLGRRQALDASEQQTDCSWPARSNYGNINLPAEFSAEFSSSVLSSGGAGVDGFSTKLPSTGLLSSVVVQTRTPDRPVVRDMEGEVLLCAYSHNDEEELRRGAAKTVFSRELTFKTEANGTGIAPEAQPYTFPWVANYFAEHGMLPESEESWIARCHEGIGSAVASSSTVQAQHTEHAHFLLVHDIPIIEFGGGRNWGRAYCSQFGGDGRNAVHIASFAIAHKDEWQGRIEKWQQQIRQRLADGNGNRVFAGLLINDLYFLMGGGTAWVSGTTLVEDTTADPVLGNGSHFALLEGFDTGYYYYNTFDLWVYAFPAFLSGWPGLAESVFEDYLRAVDLQDETTRIIYRPAERRQVLTAGKIPHDLGSAMEDPWHDLNGYSWRDDPNVWLDHNRAFIASFYLFRCCTGRKIERGEWEILVRAADYMAGQDQDGDGLPEHGEFGDSTWDAMSLSGIGAYSGGLSIAALAVMSALSDEFDSGKAAEYRRLLRSAKAAFQRELWNGEYFNSCSQGKYKGALQTDALFGIYLADLAGLHVLPTDRIRSHLLAVYRYNYCGYEEGRIGPLLVSNPSGEEYARDGGEDLQLGEVIVGSAWAYTGMLDYYGLQQEAGEVAGALVQTLYYDSGLQFRSPAAWDGQRQFRAPLNMRPLASWFLYLNRISAEQF